MVFRVVNLEIVVGLFLFVSAFVAQADDLPALIEQTKPSVVLVGSYAETDSPRFSFRGTGFVVGNGNMAITAAHVLPELMTGKVGRRLVIQIRRPNGEWVARSATTLALDKSHDLALLRFDGLSAPALPLRKGAVREGTSIALFGFPLGGVLGFSTVTHHGIVSAVTAIAVPTPTGNLLNSSAVLQLRAGVFDILQLDATAYPGNSGGPVLDINAGDVVGVVNMVLVRAGRESALSNPSGITYAIPASFAANLLETNFGTKP